MPSRDGHRARWSIIVHGGAGAMSKLESETESKYRHGLRDAALAGAAVLSSQSSADSQPLALLACIA
ncbi:MAG: isoaspartyl peptidase/L-asparaginase, partial [Myxococcales bacterium]|nr:isoaspartyl peptidase/L-asparaginase [Myxococcales bacterium]